METDGTKLVLGMVERDGTMEILGTFDTLGAKEGTVVGTCESEGIADGTILGDILGTIDGGSVGICDGTIVGANERVTTGVGYAVDVGCKDTLGLDDGAFKVPLIAHNSGIRIHTSGLLNNESRSSCCRSLSNSLPDVLDIIAFALAPVVVTDCSLLEGSLSFRALSSTL